MGGTVKRSPPKADEAWPRCAREARTNKSHRAARDGMHPKCGGSEGNRSVSRGRKRGDAGRAAMKRPTCIVVAGASFRRGSSVEEETNHWGSGIVCHPFEAQGKPERSEGSRSCLSSGPRMRADIVPAPIRPLSHCVRRSEYCGGFGETCKSLSRLQNGNGTRSEHLAQAR